MLGYLERNGFADFTPDAIEALRENPTVMQELALAEEQAAALIAPLQTALESGDPMQKAVAFSQFKKGFPDKNLFPTSKSGLPGEIVFGGKNLLPLKEDRQAYADILRMKGIPDKDLWRALNALNKDGEVLLRTNFEPQAREQPDLVGHSDLMASLGI